MEENKLWESLKKGEICAYEQIFKRYYNDLNGYGLKLCSNPELVRDCIQSLFVTLWERREHLAMIRSLKAYLLASLRREILKMLRRDRSINNLLKLQQITTAAIQSSMEEMLIRNELEASKKKILGKALECLSERQREILYLKYYNGMSYAEIEEILGINNQSIRNHIYKALQKMKTHFKEEGAGNIM